MPIRLALILFATALLTEGCMDAYVIPESLEPQIDRTVTFTDLKRDPDAYKGKIVVLGGVVLQAKNMKEGTRIELLQLPLDDSDRPAGAMEASQGRFLVVDPEHRDPAVLSHRRITLTGEVIGKKIEMIDEFEYAFPHLTAQFIYIWPERRGTVGRQPYGPRTYYPGPYPYGYPPYWYDGPPVIIILPANPPPEKRRFESPEE